MTRPDTIDDYKRRAAELREMAKRASDYSAPLLRDLAREYDRIISDDAKTTVAHKPPHSK